MMLTMPLPGFRLIPLDRTVLDAERAAAVRGLAGNGHVRRSGAVAENIDRAGEDASSSSPWGTPLTTVRVGRLPLTWTLKLVEGVNKIVGNTVGLRVRLVAAIDDQSRLLGRKRGPGLDEAGRVQADGGQIL